MLKLSFGLLLSVILLGGLDANARQEFTLPQFPVQVLEQGSDDYQPDCLDQKLWNGDSRTLSCKLNVDSQVIDSHISKTSGLGFFGAIHQPDGITSDYANQLMQQHGRWF